MIVPEEVEVRNKKIRATVSFGVTAGCSGIIRWLHNSPSSFPSTFRWVRLADLFEARLR
jgi:hypothetical protein